MQDASHMCDVLFIKLLLPIILIVITAILLLNDFIRKKVLTFFPISHVAIPEQRFAIQCSWPFCLTNFIIELLR